MNQAERENLTVLLDNLRVLCVAAENDAENAGEESIFQHPSHLQTLHSAKRCVEHSLDMVENPPQTVLG